MKHEVAKRIRARQRAGSRAGFADLRRLRRDGHVGESVRVFADLAQADLKAMLDDLGGAEALSRAELMMVESISRLAMIEMSEFGRWVRTQDVEAGRSVGQLAARRATLHAQLGLKRRRTEVSLGEYLALRAEHSAESADRMEEAPPAHSASDRATHGSGERADPATIESEAIVAKEGEAG